MDTNLGAGGNTIDLVDATNWPTGGTGKFVIVIDPGESTEEKILCQSRSSNQLTVGTGERGFDSTTDQAHASGATVRHVFSATEADEANQAVGETLGTITTAEDLLVADAATSLKRLAVGTEDEVLVVSSSAVAWDQVQTAGIADAAVTAAKLAGAAISDSVAFEVETDSNTDPITNATEVLGTTGSWTCALPSGWTTMDVLFICSFSVSATNISSVSCRQIIQLQHSDTTAFGANFYMAWPDLNGYAGTARQSGTVIGSLTGLSATTDLALLGGETTGTDNQVSYEDATLIMVKFRMS